jgi:hypothetical protein
MNVGTMLLTIQAKHLLLQLCQCLVMKLSMSILMSPCTYIVIEETGFLNLKGYHQ